jgi:alpha-beta hydrolase superfamily lysophospholipase
MCLKHLFRSKLLTFQFIILLIFAVNCFYLDCKAEVLSEEHFTYVEDGEFSQQIHIPTYEWIPKDTPLKGIIFAIHGLTLHGKTFQVTGRTFASHGFYFIAPDMRGFGRCYADPHNKFSDSHNNRHYVNYEKSTEEFLALGKLLHQRYPNVPILLLAESLGCTTAVRMASYSPETFHSLILSAPAMRINPLMFVLPENIEEYTIGFASHLTSGISMNSFFKHLVSNDPQVVQGALDDPLIRKKLHPYELIKTLGEVRRTSGYARNLQKNIPVLVIQGSDDKCVSPGSVSKLAQDIKSDDQTIRWFYSYGHLAFETDHLRAAILVSLISWFRTHNPEYNPGLEEMEKEIVVLGGTVRD